MDPKLKKIWLKALRSGEYEQGTRSLCKNGKFCCLGVAYDVLSEGDWAYMPSLAAWGIHNGQYLPLLAAFPPESVYTEWGIEAETVDYLSARNDRGETFAEIADWIEANL